MSTPTVIARSAPIAIVAKPSRGKDNTAAENTKPRAMASGNSVNQGEGSNTRTRKDRPCDACRRRKSRCVIHEGQSSCVLCQFHTQDCTFVQSPQPRKRKLVVDSKEDSVAKRRYACKSDVAAQCSVQAS